MRRIEDDVEAWGMFLLGLSVALLIGMIAVIVWFVISAIVAYIRYKNFEKEAGEDFDRIAQEVGIGLDPDDAINIAYGVGVNVDSNNKDYTDWVAGSVFGIEEDVA